MNAPLDQSISVDCAFSGMIYAIIDVDKHKVLPHIDAKNGKVLAQLGEEIKRKLQKQHPISHPELDYSGLQ